MSAIWREFWRDEAGLILSAELVIILTITVLGMVVGLVNLQNAILGEFGDLSLAFHSLNQSYSTPTFRGCWKAWGPTSWKSGSSFVDVVNDGFVVVDVPVTGALGYGGLELNSEFGFYGSTLAPGSALYAGAAGFPEGPVESWTIVQIQSLSIFQIQSLTAVQIQAFTGLQIQAFSGAQTQIFSAAQIQSLTASQIQALTGLQIQAFTTLQIQALTVSQIQALTTLQIQALTGMQVQALTSAQIQALSVTQIQALNTVQIQALTIQQIRAMTVIQIQSLTTSQRESMSRTQIEALSGAGSSKSSSGDEKILTPRQNPTNSIHLPPTPSSTHDQMDKPPVDHLPSLNPTKVSPLHEPSDLKRADGPHKSDAGSKNDHED